MERGHGQDVDVKLPSREALMREALMRGVDPRRGVTSLRCPAARLVGGDTTRGLARSRSLGRVSGAGGEHNHDGEREQQHPHHDRVSGPNLASGHDLEYRATRDLSGRVERSLKLLCGQRGTRRASRGERRRAQAPLIVALVDDRAARVEFPIEAPRGTAHRSDAGQLAQLLGELEIEHVIVEVRSRPAQRVIRPAPGVEAR